MNIFNFIKSHVSILDVISEYASLKKAGNYYKGRCPFHHEKSASFTVSPHKDIFYCFGCHLGGDVISFISKVENCTQIESARFLADRYNIDIPQDIQLSDQNNVDKKHYFDVYERVALWCHDQLYKNASVLQYIQNRGIDEAHIKQFSLGYFPGGLPAIKALLTTLQKEHILTDDIIKAGIIAQGKMVLYSPFEDRIIFPIKDHLGRFCAFGGRIFKLHDTRAKYYNSRENENFNKGGTLFGLDLAKKSIQQKEIVFMVEGYTDCIAMVQHGYPNTVATLGTACTITHLKLLARYAQYVYLMYDSDKAGQQAILRLTQLCWQANMELKVVQLPQGQDPASFLQAGNSLKSRIDSAQDIFLFYIESLGKGFSSKSLHEKVQLTRALLSTIQPLDDPLKQDILLQSASKVFDIPFSTLKEELIRIAQKEANTQKSDMDESAPETMPSAQDNIPASSLEKRIFCAIIQDSKAFGSSIDNYLITYMPSPLSEILDTLKKLHNTSDSFEFSDFFDRLSQDHQQYVSKALLEHEYPIDAETLEELLIQFHKNQWKLIVRSVSQQLAQAKQEGDQEKISTILADFQNLKQKILPTLSTNQS